MQNNQYHEKNKNIYSKLINKVFTSLQLSVKFNTRSISFLIENSKKSYFFFFHNFDNGIMHYIEGYFTVVYFIAGIINTKFNGFFFFIKSNSFDFLNFLKLFTVYNAENLLPTEHENLNTSILIKNYILKYLIEKNLLNYDLNDLFYFMFRQIVFLKNSIENFDNSQKYFFEKNNDDFFLNISEINSISKLFQNNNDNILSNSNNNNTIKNNQIKQHNMIDFDFQPVINQDFKNDTKNIFNSNIEELIDKNFEIILYKSDFNFAFKNFILFHLKKDFSYSKNTQKKKLFQGDYILIIDLFLNKKSSIDFPKKTKMKTNFDVEKIYTLNKYDNFDNDIDQKKINSIIENGICGLKNLGSTCYVNLTIQLLLGIPAFISFFLDNNFKLKSSEITKLSKDNLSSHPSDFKNCLNLTNAFSQLINSINQNSGKVVIAKNFLISISNLKPVFSIPNTQQDAQEFLLFILDRLHIEFSEKIIQNKILKLEDFSLEPNVCINNKDKYGYLEWYKHLLKTENHSPINDLFEGHFQNKLICNFCNFESITYSSFNVLSLPIKDLYGKDFFNLTDCLTNYTKDEILVGENAWKCSNCSRNLNNDLKKKKKIFKNVLSSKLNEKKKKAMLFLNDTKNKLNSLSLFYSGTTKTIRFIKLPQVFFIHLSRFFKNNLNINSKISIKIPLKLKFMNQEKKQGVFYNLLGFINHHGTTKSGHFTSYVNRYTYTKENPYSRRWIFFDDEDVKFKNFNDSMFNFDKNEINSNDAYILCYEKS